MKSFKSNWANTSNSDKEDFAISLLVIGLVAIFIGYYSLGIKTDKSAIQYEDIITLSDSIPSDEDLSSINELIISQKVYKSRKINLNKYKPSQQPITFIAETKTNKQQEPRDSSSITLNDSTLLMTKTSDSVSVDNNDLILVDSDSINTNNNQKTIGYRGNSTEILKPSEIDSNTECIILIGSYLRLSNADKMYHRLISAGYTNAFTSRNNEYTRVALYTDCNLEVLQSNLQDIKNKFASDAIHLVEK